MRRAHPCWLLREWQYCHLAARGLLSRGRTSTRRMNCRGSSSTQRMNCRVLRVEIQSQASVDASGNIATWRLSCCCLTGNIATLGLVCVLLGLGRGGNVATRFATDSTRRTGNIATQRSRQLNSRTLVATISLQAWGLLPAVADDAGAGVLGCHRSLRGQMGTNACRKDEGPAWRLDPVSFCSLPTAGLTWWDCIPQFTHVRPLVPCVSSWTRRSSSWRR